MHNPVTEYHPPRGVKVEETFFNRKGSGFRVGAKLVIRGERMTVQRRYGEGLARRDAKMMAAGILSELVGEVLA